MSNAMNTPGAFSWNELATSDLEGAKRFYSKLLGWQLEEMPCEATGTYVMAKVDGKEVAGMMGMMPGCEEMPSAWGGYITVENVDELVTRVPDLGGSVCVEPQDIPKVGRFCMIQDPQGAMFAVITYTDEAKQSDM